MSSPRPRRRARPPRRPRAARRNGSNGSGARSASRGSVAGPEPDGSLPCSHCRSCGKAALHVQGTNGTKTSRGARGPAVVLIALGCALVGAGPALAAGWLPSVPLSNPGKDTTSVTVRMDDAGDSVAVWERSRPSGPGTAIQASTRQAGQPFSTPVDLSDHGTAPVLAMAPNGEAIAVWRELDGDLEEVEDEVFLNI